MQHFHFPPQTLFFMGFCKVLSSFYQTYLTLIFSVTATWSYGTGQGTVQTKDILWFTKIQHVLTLSCIVCHITTATEMEKQQES